jgi:hypothetical protein
VVLFLLDREFQMDAVRGFGHRLRGFGVAGLLALASALSGCGYDAVVHSWFDHSSGDQTPAGPKLPGHVYLLRGLVGDIYSLGMDQLADKINHHGVTATVHGITEYDAVADTIISKYKSGEERGPVMLVGHSTGGDLIVAIAERMKSADIPVAVAFGLDPTRVADNVPANVGLFINIYQSLNPIGGGEASAASDYKGRLINVDLREHNDIVHISLDKTAVVQDRVADKVAAVAADAARSAMGIKRAVHGGGDVRPLRLRYVVPRDAEIVLFDSATEHKAKSGETVESIAAAGGVPAWAVVQINKIDQDHPLESGRMLLVPHIQYADASLPTPPPVPPKRQPVARSAPRLQEPVDAEVDPPPAPSPPARASSFTDRFKLEPTQ